MSFVGGALFGAAIGLGGGVILARRRRSGVDADSTGHSRARRTRSDRGAVAIVMAGLALAVSGVALVRSNRHDGVTASAAGTTITSPSTTAPARTASPTTPVGSGAATVAVPNVVGLARSTAEASLQKAGLKASVETLPLANVPAGFVISQSPLPAALVTVGAPVSLVVSGAT
jgi:PASTA domain